MVGMRLYLELGSNQLYDNREKTMITIIDIPRQINCCNLTTHG